MDRRLRSSPLVKSATMTDPGPAISAHALNPTNAAPIRRQDGRGHSSWTGRWESAPADTQRFREPLYVPEGSHSDILRSRTVRELRPSQEVDIGSS